MVLKRFSMPLFAAIIWSASLLCTQAVRKADVKGPDFPLDTILLISGIVFAVTIIVGLSVAWKSASVEHVLSSAFERFGSLAGNHPVKVMAMGALMALVLGGGFRMVEDETDPYTLWIPKGSLGLEHREYVENVWPALANPEMMIALPSSGEIGENMLTASYMQKIYRDYKAIDSVTVDGDEIRKINDDCCPDLAGTWSYSGSVAGTNKICFEAAPGKCFTTSILALFDYNEAAILSLTDASLLDAIDKWHTAPIWSVVPTLNVHKTFELTTVLGDMSITNGKITGAKLIRQVLMSKMDMYNGVRSEPDGRKKMQPPLLFKWTADMACYLGLMDLADSKSRSCSNPDGIMYKAFLVRSFEDIFQELINGDIPKMIMSYYLIIMYMFCTLGKRDSVHSMIGMALCSVICVGLSYVSGVGLGAYLKVKSNPLINNIPFLLLGLGVDDAFVLASEFNRHFGENPGAAASHLTALTAKTGGLSVLVTSFTDALAFLIGSSTKLPALSAFCIFAGCGVSMCFVFVMLLFLPALAIDAARAKQGRLDCCCCFKASVEHNLEEPQGCCGCPNSCQPRDKVLQRVLGAIAQFTTKVLPVKILVIVSFFGLFVVGFIGLTQMETNFELEWFLPKDSSLAGYLALNDKYFATGADFEIYMADLDVFEKRAALSDVSQYLSMQDFIIASSVKDWWYAYSNGRTLATDSNAFWQDFWQWFKSIDGSEYRRMMQWVHADCNTQERWSTCQPAQGIENSYFDAQMKVFQSGQERFNHMYTLRNDLKDLIGDSTGMKLFPYSMQFLTWEEVGIIKEELIRNLVIASGVICVIICLLIPVPRISFIVILNILASVVEVVGIAHFWGQTFNGVTTIYFLICVGLGVDYSAHVGHMFKDCKGTCEDRALLALTRIGPSVMNALISTFLAVIVLAFAESFIVEVFFRILFLVTLISGSHGVILLPVILSIVGGDALEVSSSKEDAAASPHPGTILSNAPCPAPYPAKVTSELATSIAGGDDLEDSPSKDDAASKVKNNAKASSPTNTQSTNVSYSLPIKVGASTSGSATLPSSHGSQWQNSKFSL